MLGGGLSELRQTLAASGVNDPLWFEVPKSAKAPKCVRKAIKQGVDLLFVWGGDGMVQRCIDAAAGSGVTSRSFRRAPPIFSPPSSASRRTFPKPSRSAYTGHVARSMSA